VDILGGHHSQAVREDNVPVIKYLLLDADMSFQRKSSNKNYKTFTVIENKNFTDHFKRIMRRGGKEELSAVKTQSEIQFQIDTHVYFVCVDM